MSATRLTKLSRANLAGAVLLISAGLLLSVTQAQAEIEKGRGIYHIIKEENIEVGDVPGHILGVGEEKGLIFYENGEIAIYSGVGTWDGIQGSSGTHLWYALYTFEDGSTQVIKMQGSGTAVQEGEIGSPHKGTYSYIGGTGRFEGIQGGGSYSGKDFISIATGYYDFTGTYTLPKK